MKFREKSYSAELVVVGAGIPGICAAIQAARRGMSVILINDRGTLGGNASAEIGVSVNGASDGGPLNLNSREGGICSEILTEYQYRTPVKRSRYVFDGVLIDFINREKNIKVFLNTCIDDAQMDGNIIKGVSGTQNTTETRWSFTGKYYVDNTGDGTLGALAGAEFMLGREAKETFDETIAPDKADKYVIPSTLMFYAFDAGYNIPYKAPDFAFDLPKSGALERRVIPQDKFHSIQWYYEIGGDYDHVFDKEEIIRDHKKLVYGIWDHVKNSGKYPQAQTYDLEYISCIPGTREYRRLVGDYILTEKDIIEQREHYDTVGHGGWNIDLHAIKGFFDEDIINRHIHFPGVYKIPYRTGYSKNINNMFMCGRCMSTSHVAFGSTRVSATLSTLGQAVGMAATLCKKYDCDPRSIANEHINELQQELLKEDQLIVGRKNTDVKDMASNAIISASSKQELNAIEQKSYDIEKIVASIMPEYKKRVGSEYKDFADGKRLDCALALSLPINEKLDSLSVKLQTNCDSVLNYRVFSPRVKENYGPDDIIYENSIELKKCDDFVWVELPIDIIAKDTYLLVELLENENITAAVSREPLPNTMMFRSYINKATNVVSYDTMQMANRVLKRSPLTICYKTTPQQNAYDASYIVNGYNRAYGLTNMWLSAKDDRSPQISLKWDKPITCEKIQITFASDTTKRIYWEVYDEVYDLVAKSYDIYAMIDGKEELITQIKDNFKKVNAINVDNITTDEINIKFLDSNTGQIGVYEVRVY